MAPLAILPVALVFEITRALAMGDLRGAFAAPLTAAMIAIVGYPLAVIVGWALLTMIPAIRTLGLGSLVLVGIASAETAFWSLLGPFWERTYSNFYLACLVAVCGAAVAIAFRRNQDAPKPKPG